MKKKSVQRRKIKKSNNTPFLLTALGILVLLIFGIFSYINNPGLVEVKGTATGNTAPSEVIVKYRKGINENDKEKIRISRKGLVKQRIDKLNSEVIKVQVGTVEEAVAEYSQNPLVEYAEPNFKAHSFSISNDASLSQQWGLFKIDAAEDNNQSAWDLNTGSSSVKIAILDTGIEESHSDLAGKVVGSFNFTTTMNATDLQGHGTHVAGIVAASTNNGSGVAGTGYNSVLLNGKVLADDGSGYHSWIANGIIWAADQGAQVINMSLGGTSSSITLQDAINYAWNKGSVVVAAAGNSSSTVESYPGAYPNVIAVAATDINDLKASYSNYGSWVDVAAPGSSIYSTYKGNSYASMSGTSMATPFTSGVAALIWSKGICSTNSCVRDQIEKTADPITGTGTDWAYGRINAYKALSPLVTSTPTQPTPTPTLAPIITPTPTSTAPTTTPILTMTVSDIAMSYVRELFSQRRITTAITVLNKDSNAAISSATVNATITSPSGKVSSYSGLTNSLGKATFSLRSKELGTFTTKIVSATKLTYTYQPTITSQSIVVR
ncbi:MAG TPA: S8 family serine peptidase [Candidatus Limnocylindrales bacterium]|nr:S8 family serine peptidase [Candidatus Limnocylindrales bacterium]